MWVQYGVNLGSTWGQPAPPYPGVLQHISAADGGARRHPEPFDVINEVRHCRDYRVGGGGRGGGRQVVRGYLVGVALHTAQEGLDRERGLLRAVGHDCVVLAIGAYTRPSLGLASLGTL